MHYINILNLKVIRMSRNLRAQMKYVINTSYYGDDAIGRNGGRGSSKHSDKINHTKNGKIYSYNQKDNLESVGNEFTSFMKEYHPEIKNLSDLNERHATEFIAFKSNQVSTTTLNYYRSSLSKISECVNHTFNSCNISLETQPVEGARNELIKTVSFTKNDLTILKNSYQENSTGWKAVSLIEVAGLRVSEVANLKNNDITIKDGKASVYVSCGKGGRQRTVEVSNKEYIDTLKYIKENNNENIFTCKSESIDINIHRHIKQCDLSQNYTYNTCHSIRKYYAQETYDQYRKDGMSINESVSHTIENLGHSGDRIELTKVYIQNIH